MPDVTGNVIAAIGAGVAATGANKVNNMPIVSESMLSLPWAVIAVASLVSGVVSLIAAVNRKAAEGVKPGGAGWALIEFSTGVVAGAAMWAITEFMNPDPKLQLAVAIFAGWQARTALDKWGPELWRRITGSSK